jgi:hypothetical protein
MTCKLHRPTIIDLILAVGMACATMPPAALSQPATASPAAQRQAALQAAIAREALAEAAQAGGRDRGAAFPPPRRPDEKLADWGLKWLNVTERVPAGATSDAFMFIEGRPVGHAYPLILVDVRAEYSAPLNSEDGSPYRSQFYRLEMDCTSSTVRFTTIATFSGNGLQGDARFEPGPLAPPSAIAPRSAMWMIETQACPMAQGKPPPGFQR